MPLTKAAKKALKRSRTLTELRAPLKIQLKKTLKSAKKSLVVKDRDVQTILSEAFSVIDKASQKNIIHRNNAARKKSRLVMLSQRQQD